MKKKKKILFNFIFESLNDVALRKKIMYLINQTTGFIVTNCKLIVSQSFHTNILLIQTTRFQDPVSIAALDAGAGRTYIHT